MKQRDTFLTGTDLDGEAVISTWRNNNILPQLFYKFRDYLLRGIKMIQRPKRMYTLDYTKLEEKQQQNGSKR